MKKIIINIVLIYVKNQVDSVSLVPFYEQLYSDMTVLNGNINILNEYELKQVFEENNTANDDYLLVMSVKEGLLGKI